MKNLKKLLAAVICFSMILSLCACGGAQPSPAPAPTDSAAAVPDGSTFSVTFFDVGQADAALVECDGNYMLIDGGNKADSQKMYAILKEKNIGHLEYVVASNINAEHIGGLAGALNYATAGMTLCPVEEDVSDAFNDFKKYADKNGGGIKVPSVGNKYKLGIADIEIIGVNAADGNNSSIVLKITYGETAFLFAGDAEIIAERAMLEKGADLRANVLKAANHGGDKSTSSSFLRETAPDFVVVSAAGAGGYPGEEFVNLMEIAAVNLYRTDLHGDISCTSDGKTVTFATEKEAKTEDLFKAGTASVTKTEQKKEEQQQADTPEKTPAPTAAPIAAPTATPKPTPTPKPTVNIGVDELYEANLITNLVNAYGSVKTVDHYMNTTFINGYFKAGDGYANLRTGIDTVSGQCTYSGWYNGYNFYDNGTRVVQQVFAEELDGDSIVPGQQDLAYYFMNHEDVEYIGRNGKDYVFCANIYPLPYTLTVDSQSLAVKKVEWDANPGTDKMEYIYGEWVEGQDILNAWTMDGSPMKMVNVYVDLYNGGEHVSLYRPFYIPASWELEIDSMVQQVYTYMDANYTQPYVYPGDEVGYYDLYVTNAVG